MEDAIDTVVSLVKTSQAKAGDIILVKSDDIDERTIMLLRDKLKEHLPDTKGVLVAGISTEDDIELVSQPIIKALAEALWKSGWLVGPPGAEEWHSRHCPQGLPPAAAPCTCSEERAALKMAGY